MRGRNWFLITAVADFAVAALLLAVMIIGPRGYVFFGVGIFAPAAAIHSPALIVLTVVLAGLFVLFGFTSLSAAGMIRRLPLIGFSLSVSSFLYLARGFLLRKELRDFWSGSIV